MARSEQQSQKQETLKSKANLRKIDSSNNTQRLPAKADPVEKLPKTSKAQKADKASPVIAQYLEIKAVNPGYLLMYQLGDFFELFFEDAIIASEKLGLTLTKRGYYQGKDIPMAGVPLKVADEYLQKAIRAGLRVAVVEQMEDPAEAKKRGPKAVVKRDVTRLVTPGTLTEDNLLEDGANNYLTAFFQNPSDEKQTSRLYSLASLDLSTGEFLVSEVKAQDFNGELARLNPSEIIISDAIHGEPHIRNLLKAHEFTEKDCAHTPVPHSYFSSLSGERDLKSALKVSELTAFGDFTRGELAAIAALLKYVDITQIGKKPLIRPPSRAVSSSAMVIDAATRINLELLKSTRMTKKGSLYGALDRTVTNPGARLLAQRISAPLNEQSAITDRLNALEFFITHSAKRDTLRQTIRHTPDMARALSRLNLNRTSPRDLGAIKRGLQIADEVSLSLQDFKEDHLPTAIINIRQQLLFASGQLKDKLIAALNDDLPHQTKDGDFIKKDYNAELDEERTLRDESHSIMAELQAEYRKLTGVKNLKIRHNNQFGFFVEVTALNASALQNGPMMDIFRHRQTLANNVRFTTETLVDIEAKITRAADRALDIEKKLFNELRDNITTNSRQISEVCGALAELDVILALALLSEEENYTRPTIDDSTSFDIKNGRHPVVEQALRQAKSGPFIENDCALAKPNGNAKTSPGDSANLWILTGPNMAGKSTFLRQNALIAIMAQMGCFVPAKSVHIGLIDRLFSRVGASDDLARGRSTFMVEMVETAAILNQATNRSLVILDEIGRGTATFDGLSIAFAAVEYLHDKCRARALFATHYHELTTLAEKLQGVTNATIEVKEWNDEIVFLHRVIMGAADRSYGIQVAKLAGLPAPVIKRAHEVLAKLESENKKSGAINQLEDLPLFSLDTPEPETSTCNETNNLPIMSAYALKLQEELAAINPDDITPKIALELIYRLKSIPQTD